MTFGEQVKKKRLTRLMNQAQLAVATGYSVSMVQKIEADADGPGTVAKATIAKFLEIPFDIEGSLEADERRKRGEAPAPTVTEVMNDLKGIADQIEHLLAKGTQIPPEMQSQLDRLSDSLARLSPPRKHRLAARKKREDPK